MDRLRLALLQSHPLVGAVESNAAALLDQAHAAVDAGAQLIVAPEMALLGYPPDDLVLRDDIQQRCAEAIEEIAAQWPHTAALVIGAPHVPDGRAVRNAAVVIARGRVRGWAHKQHLPTYGVFDERRVFRAGEHATALQIGDARVGIAICEDLWMAEGPAGALAHAGCDIVLCPSASPFHAGKMQERERMLAQRAVDHGVHLAYCNMIGGQDELIFDGGTVVIGPDGRTRARAERFSETALIVDVDLRDTRQAWRRNARLGAMSTPDCAIQTLTLPSPEALPDRIPGVIADDVAGDEEIWKALVLALRDYVDRNRFPSVVLGLSGGIDSAAVCALAVDALGADRVRALVMPGPYSTDATQNDARAMAAGLGVACTTVSIAEPFAALRAALQGPLDSTAGLTEENLQARTRAALLLAVSNQEGSLLLTTGNKSEIAVAYFTHGGDGCGGFSPLRDVPKTRVFSLCRWRNEQSVVIPPSIIERPPSAELAEDQRDDQSLPPYEILDPILEAYVERDMDAARIVDEGFDEEVVVRVLGLVDRGEFKRRQAPPGPKITPRAFGRDRRMPITRG